MKTASYFTFFGPGRVGITRGAPRHVAGYKMFRVLAPERHTLGMDFEEYRQHYDDILRNLDPRATWNELHKLAGGHEPVLLCFERPPFHRNNWCHRRMVAAWFAATLNEDVEEFAVGLVGVFGEPL